MIDMEQAERITAIRSASLIVLLQLCLNKKTSEQISHTEDHVRMLHNTYQQADKGNVLSLFMVSFLQHSQEEAEERTSSNGGGNDIGHRFCQKYSEHLIRKKVRQDEDHGDQKDDFSKKCHDKRNLCLPQCHKSLLTGNLETYRESQSKEYSDGPSCVTHKCCIIGKDPGEEIGEQRQHQPKHNGVSHTSEKLTEESFLHTVKLSGTVVIADKGLSSLTDARQRHGYELVDGCQNGHSTDCGISAKPGQRRCEGDGKN